MAFDGDVLGYWGRNIVEDYHDVLLKKLPSFVAQLGAPHEGGTASLQQPDTTPPQPPRLSGGANLRAGRAPPQLPSLPTEGHDMHRDGMGKVGILGAGVGGLYTALILDSLDIKYEILEASNRTGGRLFTHKFKNGNDYDYYVCHSFHARWRCLQNCLLAIPSTRMLVL